MAVILLVFSTLIMPSIAFAQDETGGSGGRPTGPRDTKGIYQGFTGGIGAVFSDDTMGDGGDMVGTIFNALLMQTLDLEDAQVLDGVYVLHASKEQTYTGKRKFDNSADGAHWLHWLDVNNDSINDYYLPNIEEEGYAYCDVRTQGGVTYNLTVGLSLTLALWDNDGSFVEAVKKVIAFGQKLAALKGEEPSEELMEEGIELMTWLLIHINDIFTGDELFVMTPFSYQSMKITPWDNMSVTKTWRRTGSDFRVDFGGADPVLNDTSILDQWRSVATRYDDNHMLWLMEDFDEADLQETLWTQFSFDILQLWIKNFHVELNVAAITSENANPAEIFEGCDIEFFMFSHHLMGAFLFNDELINKDGRPTVNYTLPKDKTGKEIQFKDGDGNVIENAKVPTSSEISHQLILGEADFTFNKPTVNVQENKVEWGIELDDPEIIPVPIGVDLDGYLGAETDVLDFIEFGVDFIIPTQEELVDDNGDGLLDARAQVKLEHNFGPWNDNDNPSPKNDIDGLDLAIIYISSVLHFHIKVENQVLESTDPTGYLQDDKESRDYVKEKKNLQIGNYISGNASDKLDFVDIGGEDYQIGTEGNTETKSPTTAVIPLGLWTGTHESHTTELGDEDTLSDDFTSDVNAEADHSVMLYAVCYPDFDGSGNGIWHDPTFSVYMAFTGSTVFWALILLVGGVGFVGIATILITRRKNRMY